MIQSLHYLLAWMDTHYRDAYWDSVAQNQLWHRLIEQCVADKTTTPTSTSRIHLCA